MDKACFWCGARSSVVIATVTAASQVENSNPAWADYEPCLLCAERMAPPWVLLYEVLDRPVIQGQRPLGDSSRGLTMYPSGRWAMVARAVVRRCFPHLAGDPPRVALDPTVYAATIAPLVPQAPGDTAGAQIVH